MGGRVDITFTNVRVLVGITIATKEILHSVGLMTSVVARLGTSSPPVTEAMGVIVGTNITAICVFGGGNISAKGSTHSFYLFLAWSILD